MVRSMLLAAVAVALALGGAGLVGQLSHPPGDARRAELTWAGDRALAAPLDDLTTRLQAVGSLVDTLDGDAKAALIAVSSGDDAGLRTVLDRGAQRATTIDATVTQLQASLAATPGGSPSDATRYSSATLVLRASLAAALSAVGSLSDEWSQVAARSTDASALIVAIRTHDTTLANAAAAGVKAQYAKAITLCNAALGLIDDITAMRKEFVQPGQTTILDDWLARHARYDEALLALYQALKQSGGVRNAAVDAAYKEQQAALAELPLDNREIVVIISQVAQGGLNEAVLAIEFARGQIDAAIEALPSPSPS